MNVMELGGIGEVVRSIAVIATLIYLAVLVHRNTLESRHATTIALVQEWNGFLSSLSDSANASVWCRGLQEFHTFDPTEQAQWGALVGRFMRSVEALYLEKLDGREDTRVWPGVHRNLLDLCTYAGTRTWWDRRRRWYSTEFVALVDQCFSEVSDLQDEMYDHQIDDVKA